MQLVNVRVDANPPNQMTAEVGALSMRDPSGKRRKCKPGTQALVTSCAASFPDNRKSALTRMVPEFRPSSAQQSIIHIRKVQFNRPVRWNTGRYEPLPAPLAAPVRALRPAR